MNKYSKSSISMFDSTNYPTENSIYFTVLLQILHGKRKKHRIKRFRRLLESYIAFSFTFYLCHIARNAINEQWIH